jgi:hypothetical protein
MDLIGRGFGVEAGFMWLRRGIMEEYFENGNEPPCFTK